jgi:hypothetical protein
MSLTTSDENRGVQINSVVTQYLFYQPEGVSLADIIVSKVNNTADNRSSVLLSLSA